MVDNANDESQEGNNYKDEVINSKYKIMSKLGEGSFGMIFKASYKNNIYALKFERIIPGHKSMLMIENIIMSSLYHKNIAKVYELIENYNSKNEYNIMVMDLLGKSLETLLKLQDGEKFSIKTTAMLALQMIEVLEYVHSEGIIHRDIKPDNFCMGQNDNDKKIVYLLDFGLAKKYINSKTLKHNPFSQSNRLTGTARYASINASEGCEQSRRDDLESLGYVILYMVNGKLPWQCFHEKNKEERYNNILVMKKKMKSKDICKGLPIEFEKYLQYCRQLNFEETPDYGYLKGLFKKVLEEGDYKLDYVYDWDNSVMTEEKAKLEEELQKQRMNKKMKKYMDAADFLNNEELFNMKKNVNVGEPEEIKEEEKEDEKEEKEENKRDEVKVKKKKCIIY